MNPIRPIGTLLLLSWLLGCERAPETPRAKETAARGAETAPGKEAVPEDSPRPGKAAGKARPEPAPGTTFDVPLPPGFQPTAGSPTLGPSPPAPATPPAESTGPTAPERPGPGVESAGPTAPERPGAGVPPDRRAPAGPAPEVIPTRRSEPGDSSFTDVTDRAGVGHLHERPSIDPKLAHILPWVASAGAAAAASDYDNDGDIDLYVTNSRGGRPNVLYRNNGDMTFTDAASRAGVADLNDGSGVSVDAAFGDIDNDGYDDLYVARWGGNLLFRNKGDGTFADVTGRAGVGDGGNASAVLFLDYDGDGLLDLYVANDFPEVNIRDLDDTRILPDRVWGATNGGANRLYRNRGDGTFVDVAPDLGLDGRGWTRDAGASDIDHDGDMDLYLAEEFGPDQLWLNLGNGRFAEVFPDRIGVDPRASTSVEFADVDGDGRTDLFVSHATTADWIRDGNALLLGRSGGVFRDAGAEAGVSDGGWSWCGKAFDVDHDGDLDLVQVNGFHSGSAKEGSWAGLVRAWAGPGFDLADGSRWPAIAGQTLSGSETARLFLNDGHGGFTDAAEAMGIAHPGDGRGIVLADLDNDGDQDVFIVHQGGRAALFRNNAPAGNRWLVITLAGTRSNRNAIGARVEIRAGRHRIVREVDPGNGFAAQSSRRIHVGLSREGRVERLDVLWPSGAVQSLRDIPSDQHIRIVEAEAGEAAKGVEPGDGPRVKRTRTLFELEELVARYPSDPRIANTYRMECVRLGHYDRSIGFFRRLIDDLGESVPAALQLALAYIDKTPAKDQHVMERASLAKESLHVCDDVIHAHPGLWTAHFIRGMNHLYWPAGLKRFDLAMDDFRVCLGIQQRRGVGTRAYYSSTRVALGDCHVKANNFARAREIWKEALELFPDDRDLHHRLQMGNKELGQYIKVFRGLGEKIDTDLEFLAEETGLGELEEKLRQAPGDAASLGAYRVLARESRESERAVGFLADLEGTSGRPEVSLHLALARIDAIPPATGTDREALVKGALEALDRYRSSRPDDPWGSFFTGMLHLHRGGGGSRARAALESALGSAGATRRPVFLLALGDAYARAGDLRRARALWTESLDNLPQGRAARRRLEASEAAVRLLVEVERSLDHPIPTHTDMEGRIPDLSALEEKIRSGAGRDTCDAYREACRRSGAAERAVRFFRSVQEGAGDRVGYTIELALALLDAIPSRHLAPLEKARMAREALGLLEGLRDRGSSSWAYYTLRGLIHLHSPLALSDAKQASTELERAMKIARASDERDPSHALIYQALGDSLVRGKSFTRYRDIWKEGATRFPEDRGLERRMGCTYLMVEPLVARERRWAVPLDTDRMSLSLGDLWSSSRGGLEGAEGSPKGRTEPAPGSDPGRGF